MDKPAGDEFFTVEHFRVPKGIKLLVGGMDFLPNGDLPYAPMRVRYGLSKTPLGLRCGAVARFARGLNEPGGLRVIKGQIYARKSAS